MMTSSSCTTGSLAGVTDGAGVVTTAETGSGLDAQRSCVFSKPALSGGLTARGRDTCRGEVKAERGSGLGITS